MGSEADWGQLDPDFAAGKKALVAEDWNGAIAALKLAALRDPRDADIQNYLGYAYRRLRQLGPAMQHYQEAILLNRRHRTPTSTSENFISCSRTPAKRATSWRHWKKFESKCPVRLSPLGVDLRVGSNSVIRPTSAQCPVLPKADTGR